MAKDTPRSPGDRRIGEAGTTEVYNGAEWIRDRKFDRVVSESENPHVAHEEERLP